MTENPHLFIVGSERSGSTLLSLMLEGHPDLGFVRGGEFDRCVALVGDDGTRPTISQLKRHAEMDYEFFFTRQVIDADLTYDENVAAWLAESLTRNDSTIACAVVHTHFGRLRHLFDDARYIHLLRDGRDVSMSCVKMGWTNDVWHGGDRWMHAESEWDVLSQHVPATSTLEVRYEDLVTDPETQLTRMCEFLDIVAEPQAMLSYSTSGSYEAPHTLMTANWRTWTDRDVRLAEGRLGEVLSARGYELSGKTPLVPSPRELSLIRLRGRIKGLVSTARENGPVTTAAELVGRRLNQRRLSAWASARINATTKQNLEHVSAGVAEARSELSRAS